MPEKNRVERINRTCSDIGCGVHTQDGKDYCEFHTYKNEYMLKVIIDVIERCLKVRPCMRIESVPVVIPEDIRRYISTITEIDFYKEWVLIRGTPLPKSGAPSRIIELEDL